MKEGYSPRTGTGAGPVITQELKETKELSAADRIMRAVKELEDLSNEVRIAFETKMGPLMQDERPQAVGEAQNPEPVMPYYFAQMRDPLLVIGHNLWSIRHMLNRVDI